MVDRCTGIGYRAGSLLLEALALNSSQEANQSSPTSDAEKDTEGL
jgi:hypothetical protein